MHDDEQARAAPSIADSVLLKYVAAQRVFGLYPAKNPKVYAAVAKVREELAPFPTGSPLDLEVGRDFLFVDANPILTHVDEVRELGRKLYLAHVTGLILQADVTDDELIAFLSLMKLTDQERRDLGSFAEELRRRGIEHILVREAGRVTMDAGRVALEEVAERSTNPWDLASLDQIDELTDHVLDGERSGFHESFRSVNEGQDQKTGRLLGLLDRPTDFATLLLDTASRQKTDQVIDLDQQLAVMIDLVARLEPMVKGLPPEILARVHQKLSEVITIIEHAIYRELMEVVLPPYVRLGRIRQLFPDRIRPMTVKEALSLGLGPGMMPALMAGLRRIAQGDNGIPDFLEGDEAASAEALVRGVYRPIPLPSAPPNPGILGPRFFEPTPNGKRHPGEQGIADAITEANGMFDSVATLLDVMAVETEMVDYEVLTSLMVRRFKACLETRNFVLGSQVVAGLRAEQERRTATNRLSEHGRCVATAIEQCGKPEVMAAFARAIDGVDESELDKAVEPLLSLTSTAVASLMELLAEEPKKETRMKLVNALTRVGRTHVDSIAAFGSHPAWYVVRNVVCILASVPGAVPRLAQLVAHPEPRVRRELVRSLGHFRDDIGVINALTHLVHDDNDAVLRDAVHKLVELSGFLAAPALLAEVKSPRFGTRHPATIATVLRGLGVLGDSHIKAELEAMAAASDRPGALASPRAAKLLTDAAAAIAERLAQGGRAS